MAVVEDGPYLFYEKIKSNSRQCLKKILIGSLSFRISSLGTKRNDSKLCCLV